MEKIFIGTWALGDSYWGEQKHNDSVKMIHASLRNDFLSFDTAPIYGNGSSEQLLGQQLKNRSDVTISTKILVKPLSAVKKSFENSLKRLNKSSIYYCFIHWPSTKFEVEPVMDYLMKQKERGLIKHIGVSNFNQNGLKKVQKYGEVDIVQNGYNFLWPWEEEFFTYCKKNNIQTQAYSPLAQGLLTGKFTSKQPYKSDDKRDHMVLFYPEVLPEIYHFIEQLQHLANIEQLNLSQMILKWTIDRNFVDSVVVGCRNRSQVENLKGINSINISMKTKDKLDEIHNKVKTIIPYYSNIFNHSY